MKLFKTLSLAAAAVLLMAGAAHAQIKLRYAHVGVANAPQTLYADEVAKLVKERTNGRVEIQVFANSQLGGVGEIVAGLVLGPSVFGALSPDWFAAVFGRAAGGTGAALDAVAAALAASPRGRSRSTRWWRRWAPSRRRRRCSPPPARRADGSRRPRRRPERGRRRCRRCRRRDR